MGTDVSEDIISECKKFKKDAQETLYRLYAPKLKAVCIRYCKIRSDAEDVLHEGFMKIFMNIEQYKGNGSFEGWMKRVVINTAISHFNKSNSKWINHIQIDENFPDQEDNNGDDNYINIIKNTCFTEEEMLETINSLPDGYRIIFNLFVLEGLKHKEISQLLKISESTSKSQLVRSRKMLQKRLYELALSKNKSHNTVLHG